MFSYLPGAEIYLVPSRLLEGEYKGLKHALNWVCLDPEEAPEPDKQLLFALCLTDRYEHRSNTEMMKAINTFPGKSSHGSAEVNEVDQESPLKERVVKPKEKHEKKHDRKHDHKKKKWRR